MVSTALILLSGRYGATVAVPTAIILAREIAVSALREWMAQRGQRDAVQVGFQGKVKTAATMVSLTLLLMVPPSGDFALQRNSAARALATAHKVVALVLLYLSCGITVTSGMTYFQAAWPGLQESSSA